jgi:hypothetical protein
MVTEIVYEVNKDGKILTECPFVGMKCTLATAPCQGCEWHEDLIIAERVVLCNNTAAKKEA